MAVRGRRLNQETCPIAMRDRDGTTEVHDVYREDLIEFVVGDDVQLGLVIDFGEEEEFAFGEWRLSGHLVVELQHVTNVAGVIEGVARPYRRNVARSLDSNGAVLFSQPWVDARLLAISPRRG
jgi:hypothetical protein